MDFQTINIGNYRFFYRSNSIGDQGVLDQIFNHEDYNIRFWRQGAALLRYYEQLESPLIVDAGANIGASALYFFINYPKSFIYSIEPDLNNFNLLQTNTLPITTKHNYHGAISSTDGEIYLHDPGQSDWGFRTSTNDSSNAIRIPAISVPSVLSSTNNSPFIIKIDIEGAEQDLFSKNTEWVDSFPLLIIELHDWMLPFSGSSRNFIQTISKFDFDIVYRGENIFCFNRRLLADHC